MKKLYIKPLSKAKYESIKARKIAELRIAMGTTPNAPLSLITDLWKIFPDARPDWDKELRKMLNEDL